MFNCNGSLVSSLTEAEEGLIYSRHTSFSIHENIRFQRDKLLFWEAHYFRIIASLRRYRFNIPMEYTMDFLQKELLKLIDAQKVVPKNIILQFQFFKQKRETRFIISNEEAFPLAASSTSYTVDLYKEAMIPAGNLSNLSATNWGIRIMAKRYAEENGLDDVVLLNEQKNLVETLNGTLYLLQKNQLITPKLDAGCQDFAIRGAFNNWLKKQQTPYQLLEQDLNPFELQKSEELMVLSLEKGIQSISNYRKTDFAQLKVQELFQAFNDNLN